MANSQTVNTDTDFQSLYLKCESVIERKFLECNYKLLIKLGYLSSQEIVHNYRVDFLLSTDHRTFVIECDGRAYHIDSVPFNLDRLKNLVKLDDETQVFYGDILYHPDRQLVGWYCIAEFPSESDMVTVRCDNGAVPTVSISDLRREPPVEKKCHSCGQFLPKD